MTDSRWHRLRRRDLIELAAEQRRQIEELTRRVEALEDRLAQQSLLMVAEPAPAPVEDPEEQKPVRRPPRLRC